MICCTENICASWLHCGFAYEKKGFVHLQRSLDTSHKASDLPSLIFASSAELSFLLTEEIILSIEVSTLSLSLFTHNQQRQVMLVLELLMDFWQQIVTIMEYAALLQIYICIVHWAALSSILMFGKISSPKKVPRRSKNRSGEEWPLFCHSLCLSLCLCLCLCHCHCLCICICTKK